MYKYKTKILKPNKINSYLYRFLIDETLVEIGVEI
jgi:hypothetical protein